MSMHLARRLKRELSVVRLTVLLNSSFFRLWEGPVDKGTNPYNLGHVVINGLVEAWLGYKALLAWVM